MASKISEILKKKVVFPIRNIIFQINRNLGRYENVIWLIGDGRSGTTWVASILNGNKLARELFEPYHPHVLQNPKLQPYLYSHSDDLDEDLVDLYSKIFTGSLEHRRIDYDNRKLWYKGLIVKDVFINLSAFALSQRFESVKPILLLRNPFAVVHSKLQKKHWFWPTDLKVYLDNSKLLARLPPRVKQLLIEADLRKNFVEIQFIHWVIGNSILLSDFTEENLHIIFYEDIKSTPDLELKKLREYLGQNFDFVAKSTNKKVFNKSSRVVGKKQRRSDHENTLKYWKGKFSSEEYEMGVNVLEIFGWSDAYFANGKPNYSFFEKYGFHHKKAL